MPIPRGDDSRPEFHRPLLIFRGKNSTPPPVLGGMHRCPWIGWTLALPALAGEGARSSETAGFHGDHERSASPILSEP